MYPYQLCCSSLVQHHIRRWIWCDIKTDPIYGLIHSSGCGIEKICYVIKDKVSYTMTMMITASEFIIIVWLPQNKTYTCTHKSTYSHPTLQFTQTDERNKKKIETMLFSPSLKKCTDNIRDEMRYTCLFTLVEFSFHHKNVYMNIFLRGINWTCLKIDDIKKINKK